MGLSVRMPDRGREGGNTRKERERAERIGRGVENDSGKHRVLLSGVSGHLKPGRVTAIMGPSGAGGWTERREGECIDIDVFTREAHSQIPREPPGERQMPTIHEC